MFHPEHVEDIGSVYLLNQIFESRCFRLNICEKEISKRV